MENSNEEVFRERREREAPSVHHRQPALPFRGQAVGLCIESLRVCGFMPPFEAVFFALAWMSGLSMIPKIMLPSLTGAQELECGSCIKASS